MHAMRNVLLGLVGAAVLAGPAWSVPAAPAATEFSAGLNTQFPGTGDFDVYDTAYGLDLQWRSWCWGAAGFALTAGLEQWEADDASNSWAAETDGSAVLIPLGASLLWRPVLQDRTAVVFEAGLRLAAAVSDLSVRDAGGREEVTLDPGVLGVLGLEIEHRISYDVSVFGGVSYRVDLLEGAAEADRFDLMDNQWESFGLTLGLRYAF